MRTTENDGTLWGEVHRGTTRRSPQMPSHPCHRRGLFADRPKKTRRGGTAKEVEQRYRSKMQDPDAESLYSHLGEP